MPNVEIRKYTVTSQTSYGPVERPGGFEMVMYDGRQAGYVPADPDDPNYRVFHPLSGFPQELCSVVVANSGGRITSSLNAPVPHSAAVQPTDLDEEDE